MASKWVRVGLISRDEAIYLVKKRDTNLDPLAIEDLCRFCGFFVSHFWSVVKKFYNRDIFFKDKNGEWKLKNPIWEE